MRTHQLHTNQKGFTLVEMLVAVSIFAIVMVVSIGTLIVLLSAGAVAQSAQVITSNLSFAVDSMSRHIRTGYDYHCSNTVPDDNDPLPSGTMDCENGASVFVFTEGESGDRTAYWFDSTTRALYQKVEANAWRRMTSTEIAIDPFSFTLTGSTGGDAAQPTVRILLKAEPIEERMDVYPFYIQTTVSSKQLNI
jgi:prepilin-type N-terminal cleavage/methylation domain-containing protein